ncbi:M24 family metallopeptidase [Thalassotalea psychrophila]|uniref:M24 family metallopeptidase n=1 Tax=Thalassotalea psychrophila TaxID=3065647 RepID=A0ABY9TW63_9GAMM|nr:M24 family metallopeptidase [Colwelliaceae bacterium SQ149]
MRFLSCCFIFLSILQSAEAKELVTTHNILSMQQRAEFIDKTTQQRVQQLLPRLMKETNIDMWILISREYNEDPILKTLLPAKWLSARRTTIFVFSLEDNDTVGSYAIAPYNVGSIFEKAWDKNKQPDQWQALLSLIKDKKPNKIGINQSKDWAHADGLVASEKEKLLSTLPTSYLERVVSAQALGVAWLEQRIPEEMIMYENIVAIAHDIIAQGFSNEVIEVGKTSTNDLVWWFRERVRELKLQAWFHPTVDIQRKDNKKFDHVDSFTNGYEDNIIQPGDLLHVDFGITYLRLNTDTQQHAYVLKENEKSAPEDLIAAFNSGNQLQDIFTRNFKVGRTGNEVLKLSRKQAIEQGLKPTIYTHPIGFHGHAAGTTLGMWDSQQGVAGSGDYPLHFNTAYSIELNNAVFLQSWDKEIRIMLEEEAFFDKDGVRYIDGRQTQLHLISSHKN